MYFATHDTTKTRLGFTAIEGAWLRDRLDECDAGRQIMILDCCFSGSFPGAKPAADLDLQRRLIGAGRGRDILTASRASEYSYEGRPLSDTGLPTRSVFTATLIDGIRHGAADLNNDGYITVEEAFDYTADILKTAEALQSPQYMRSSGEGRIVLARNPQGIPVAPARIPESLQISLHSPYPQIRIGAVNALGSWLTSTDPAEIRTARPLLQEIADQDVPAVATAARAVLDAATPPTIAAPARDRASRLRLRTAPAPSRCLRTLTKVSRTRLLKPRVWAVASAPTAPSSPPAAPTAPCGCGTPPPGNP